MMKYKSIEGAKKAYIDGIKIAEKAIEQGDSKTNNNICRKQVMPAFEYLKERGELKVLIEFLEQDDITLKQPIAVALLPYYEDISINVLEEISKREDLPFRSFKAEMVLEQWKKKES